MRLRRNPRYDSNYHAFDEAWQRVRAASRLGAGDPAIRTLQSHFWKMWEPPPYEEAEWKAWEKAKTLIGYERGETEVPGRYSQSTKWRVPVGDAYATDEVRDPYARRGHAFKNVMEAYAAYLEALAKASTQSLTGRGAMEWAPIEQEVRKAQAHMKVYGSSGGPTSPTVGLDYRNLPFYYAGFTEAVDALAQRALESRDKPEAWRSPLLIAGPSSLSGERVYMSPEKFMIRAQTDMTEHAVAMAGQDREKKYAAERASREQFKALKEAGTSKRQAKNKDSIDVSGMFEDVSGSSGELPSGFDFEPGPAREKVPVAAGSTSSAEDYTFEDTIQPADLTGDVFNFNPRPRTRVKVRNTRV